MASTSPSSSACASRLWLSGRPLSAPRAGPTELASVRGSSTSVTSFVPSPCSVNAASYARMVVAFQKSIWSLGRVATASRLPAGHRPSECWLGRVRITWASSVQVRPTTRVRRPADRAQIAGCSPLAKRVVELVIEVRLTKSRIGLVLEGAT